MALKSIALKSMGFAAVASAAVAWIGLFSTMARAEPEATSTSAAPETPAAPETSAAPVASAAVSTKPYYARGIAQFRMLAISDPDPANDRSLHWTLEGGYRFLPGFTGFAILGLKERFVAEEGESGFLVKDTIVGAKARQAIDLGGVGLEGKELRLVHWVYAYLPTSRASQAQDLYLAPEGLTQARFSVVDRVEVGMDASFQYRFHQFAERAGRLGGMNTQYALGGQLMVEYTPLDLAEAGRLTVGADVHTTWFKRFSSRDDHVSESSNASAVLQDYGWDLYAEYQPIEYLVASISLVQNGNVLRDGIVNAFFGHRDETELVFALEGRF